MKWFDMALNILIVVLSIGIITVSVIHHQYLNAFLMGLLTIGWYYLIKTPKGEHYE